MSSDMGVFYHFQQYFSNIIASCVINRIGGEMVSVLTSSAVDREFEALSGQTKD